jgi:hypothetical protein
VKGIGPETADSIALYAAGLPLFVVDAYTRRLFARLGLLSGRERYDGIQRWFMGAACRTTPSCSATITPRSCGWGRSSAGIVRPAADALWTTSARNAASHEGKGRGWGVNDRSTTAFRDRDPRDRHSPLASAQDFWKHWGDGRAELSATGSISRATAPSAPGPAVLVFVTEDMSDSLRVKADPGKHPPSDVYP